MNTVQQRLNSVERQRRARQLHPDRQTQQPAGGVCQGVLKLLLLPFILHAFRALCQTPHTVSIQCSYLHVGERPVGHIQGK